MDVEELAREGKIRRFDANRGEIARCMEIAKRDLSLAEKMLQENLDWCLAIAYNAALQSCRAYMFSRGYRPAGSDVHKTTLEFAMQAVDEPLRDTVSYFDRIRKKRHRAIYNEVGLATRKEAEELLYLVKEFMAEIEERLQRA